MSETLKPCPFCGGEVGSYHNHVKSYAYVECRKCGSHGPIEEDPAIAEQRWNTRADDNRWRSVAEQLYKALDARMVCDSECKCSGRSALSAFDSLRKEASDE